MADITCPITVNQRTVAAAVTARAVAVAVTPAPRVLDLTIEQGIRGAPGIGDMQSLIYDPQGRRANVFDAANLAGNLDGGTFD